MHSSRCIQQHILSSFFDDRHLFVLEVVLHTRTIDAPSQMDKMCIRLPIDRSFLSAHLTASVHCLITAESELKSRLCDHIFRPDINILRQSWLIEGRSKIDWSELANKHKMLHGSLLHSHSDADRFPSLHSTSYCAFLFGGANAKKWRILSNG